MLQLFLWVENYDEGDRATHVAGLATKQTLDLRRMSAARFLKYWALPTEAIQVRAVGGMEWGGVWGERGAGGSGGGGGVCVCMGGG